MKNYDAVALLSGGLDSILAVKVVEEQGLSVKCLHFHTPFMGDARKVGHWSRIHNLDIEPIDVGEAFVEMMVRGPEHGFGKTLNPCVDCKILMLREAKKRMAEYGARCIVTGEVVGQRPMSQRRDALNLIRNEAGVGEVLLRPLCAGRVEPTPVELSGLVDREKLPAISGRGRKEQLALAEHFGLKEIPTPAGGCKLAEGESSKRYWPILQMSPAPRAADFALANEGRQFWAGELWISVGRKQTDNERIEALAEPGDVLFKTDGFPGPLSLGRHIRGGEWSDAAVRDAAAFTASFSPKAVRSGAPVTVLVTQGGQTTGVEATPSRVTPMGWAEPVWSEAKAERKEQERQARESGC